MSWRSKVVWSQGMFLQPHHFQQEARYVERLIDERMRCLTPFAWGFSELVIDDASLSLGRLGIARASGVWADGTPFSIPQLDAPPPPLEIPADAKNELVYLAVPLQRNGMPEMDFQADGVDELARFKAAEEAVRDNTSATDEPEAIQTGRLNLRLVRAKDATDAYALLGVARVMERRSDGMVTLDRSYIAPQVVADATGQLSASVGLLHGLVRQRAQTLAARMGQASHGVSEMADFLMLQALNRNEPVLRQITLAPHLHPRPLFDLCLQLAGELATFSTTARRPPDFPEYQHHDLGACFAPVFDVLRQMLSAVLEQNAIQLPLVDRNYGVRTAVVSDLELVRNAGFVLAVNAQLPAEQLRQRFPAQSRVGPVEKIRDLVNFNLPGLPLRGMPVAPRQLPFHAGFHYFEIERGGELWQQFEKNGNLALHVAGDFPGLELELWAIRR
jgi:type VI secretion system protein ImpJ